MQSLLEQFRSERHAHRLQLQKVMNPAVLFEKLRGQTEIGKREDGKEVKTKAPAELSLFVRGIFVSLFIGVADRSYLSTAADADSLVREDVHRRNTIPILTDLFHAVRLFKHIKEGYRQELAGTKTVCRLEELNASLACTNADGEVKLVIDALLTLQEKMRRKSSATKLMAFAKMDHSRKLLEKAIADPSHKVILIGAACACLVAARNRYENWRIKEVLRHGSYAYLRECSLRAERDAFIRQKLHELILLCSHSDASARIFLWAKDELVMNVLKNASISNLEETIGQLGAISWGKKYVINANDLLKKDEKEKAMLELRKLLFYLSANKPYYIAEQVEKTGDSYLCQPGNSFIYHLKQGEGLFRKGSFDGSKSHFEAALRILNQTN